MKSVKKIIVGNWKMNPTAVVEAVKIAKILAKNYPPLKNVMPVICPPAVFLDPVKKELKTKKSILLGGQDAYMEPEGSFTGAVSAKMLKSVGAAYVILGHSEARYRGDTNEMVNTKIKTAIKAGLTPIVCVGEDARDESGAYLQFISTQLTETLKDIPKPAFKSMIIAYEPVWAIGKNAPRAATTAEALEIVIHIKRFLSDLLGKGSEVVPILYGASVDPKNAGTFLKEAGVNGLLVGRDSLDPKKFVEILKIAEKI